MKVEVKGYYEVPQGWDVSKIEVSKDAALMLSLSALVDELPSEGTYVFADNAYWYQKDGAWDETDNHCVYITKDHRFICENVEDESDKYGECIWIDFDFVMER